LQRYACHLAVDCPVAPAKTKGRNRSVALIVTCKDMTNTIDVLHQITRAIDNNKITNWERVGSNYFQNTKEGYRGRACFRPTIADNKIYFGLINPAIPPFSVSRAIYEDYHSIFFRVLVHLSWTYFFTVEQTAEPLEEIDAEVAE
jgi:hypothetical protein